MMPRHRNQFLLADFACCNINQLSKEPIYNLVNEGIFIAMARKQFFLACPDGKLGVLFDSMNDFTQIQYKECTGLV